MAEQFSGSYENLSFDDLIKSPLIAVSDANATMARSQFRLMMDYCFAKKEERYVPVMVMMDIGSSKITDGKVERFSITVSIPMLTLLPLSHLAVNEMAISFDMEVNMTQKIEKEKDEKVTKLFGRVANTQVTEHKQTEQSSAYSVQLKASPLPLL